MFQRLRVLRPLMIVLLAGVLAQPAKNAAIAAGPVVVDWDQYRPDGAVTVERASSRDDSELTVTWPLEGRDWGRLVLSSASGRPLLSALSILEHEGRPNAKVMTSPLLAELDPSFWVTVGKRESPADRPPSMSVFNVFFDSPAKRPHQTHRSQLRLERIRVSSEVGRARITLEKLEAGPFSGVLEITVYAGSRLVQLSAIMKTLDSPCAYFYDAGLVSSQLKHPRMSWVDTEGRWQHLAQDARDADQPITVRHRTIVAESAGGSIACFPPPHQYFFARDLTDNLSYTWVGRGHRGQEDRWGFGIRQAEAGGGAYVPWFNAPPGTEQRMGLFLLLSRGDAKEALGQSLRYTRNDRFPEIPGFATFTSHWHMEIAMAAMREEARGKGRTIPDFVAMFKEMGVKIVHLAEFHGEGHPQDRGPVRLAELAAMNRECQRLSDSDILFLPGEEANVYLGAEGTKKHPGHWLYLFPKPVYWTMQRGKAEPFREQRPGLGTVYHVGSQGDMVRLLKEEKGLAWTAHPRIKASNWAPDEYRNEEFFHDPLWLGATWKGMPTDLSRPKLGERGLNLLDDMCNWGSRKYLVGEVDVFKIDHTHELFGHMNINYLRLAKVPRFEDDWEPILDALRHGRFFVTTGEVLIHDFQVAGLRSGETATLKGGSPTEVTLDLEWTFPINFVEVVSGDGQQVYRERIHLDRSGPFEKQRLTRSLDLSGRKWVRVDAWDVASNGAFTQPIWLEQESSKAP